MENPIKMDDLGYHYFRKHPNETSFLSFQRGLFSCRAEVLLTLCEVMGWIFVVDMEIALIEKRQVFFFGLLFPDV